MSKRKAIRTSEKRVRAIVKRREAEIRADEQQRTREQLTKYLYVDPDNYGRRDYIIGHQPDQPYILVAVAPKWDRVLRMDEIPPFYSPSLETVAFKAIRKCWSDGKGTTVHWYDWEPTR